MGREGGECVCVCMCVCARQSQLAFIVCLLFTTILSLPPSHSIFTSPQFRSPTPFTRHTTSTRSFCCPARTMTVNVAGEPRCARCDRGDKDTFRLVVRSDAESTTRYLFHVHRDENLEHILLRLYKEFPNEWRKDVVYYFYVDMGGSYYPVEHAFWLRGMCVCVFD